jgi:hypothetical protein
MVERSTINRLARGIEAVATQLMKRPTRGIWAEPHETAAQAKARYLAEHPEHASYNLILISWLPPDATEGPIQPFREAGV